MLIVNQVLVCSKFPNLFQSGRLVHQDSTVLLTLRIYALYGCSLRILTYMVGSGGILMAVSLVRTLVFDVWHPRTKLLFASLISLSVGDVWAKECSFRKWRRLSCGPVKRHVKLSPVIYTLGARLTLDIWIYLEQFVSPSIDRWPCWTQLYYRASRCMGSAICIWLHHLCSHISQNVENSSLPFHCWNWHSVDLTHLSGRCV